METTLTKPEGLTPQELRVLTAFRVMDQRRKGEILPHMEFLSKTWPARRPVHLQLVKGGVSC